MPETNYNFTFREARWFLSPSTLTQIVLDLDEVEKNCLEDEEELRKKLSEEKHELIAYLRICEGIEFEHAPGDGGIRLASRTEEEETENAQ